MKQRDTYLTIANESKGLFKDKGSKFISFAFPVSSVEDTQRIIKGLKKEYHDARHHCYAYMLGSGYSEFRANDDGEPSGTAGKPILGQIRSYDLTNIMIVVIRYFGGTLLGVGGLINAYKNASVEAIENNEIIEKLIEDKVSVSFEYPNMNNVMQILKQFDLKPSSQKFEIDCNIIIDVRKTVTEQIVSALDKIYGVDVEIIE